VFEDRLTPINLVGLLVTMVAIIAYNYIKIKKMREEAQQSVHHGHAHSGSEQPSSNSSSDVDNDEGGEETGLLHRIADDNHSPPKVSEHIPLSPQSRYAEGSSTGHHPKPDGID